MSFLKNPFTITNNLTIASLSAPESVTDMGATTVDTSVAFLSDSLPNNFIIYDIDVTTKQAIFRKSLPKVPIAFYLHSDVIVFLNGNGVDH